MSHFRKMYWSDWVQRPSADKAKISVANMDGSDVKSKTCCINYPCHGKAKTFRNFLVLPK